MLGQVVVTAAVALVGYDLAQNETWNISSKPRTCKAIAIVGGNTINEAQIDFFVENVKVGSFYNTHSGVLAPLNEDVIPLGNVFVPAGSKVSLIVIVAPTVSPLIARLY